MSKRISVCGRREKIVHLELLSVHIDDVAFAVSGLRLLMKNLNRSFDNLILLLLIRVHQSVDVAELMRKVVQINPKQTPNQNEDWPDVISPTAFASPVADQDTQRADQSRHADKQPENRVGENAVTISRDLEDSLDRSFLLSNFYFSSSFSGLIKKYPSMDFITLSS